MTFAEAATIWIARKQKRDPGRYSDLSVRADYDPSYSTLTQGAGVECFLHFKYDGEDGHYYMGEREVVKFLNGVWDTSNQDTRDDTCRVD